MSYGGGYNNSPNRGRNNRRNQSNRYSRNYSNYDNNTAYENDYYNQPNNPRRGTSMRRNNQPRQYTRKGSNLNNPNPRSYSTNQTPNSPNKLQINSSRFARPQNTSAPTPYAPKYQAQTPQFDTNAFPNDWNHSNIGGVSHHYNYEGWMAAKPKIKYYTSDSVAHIGPDRVGVPQICSRGEIDDIIDIGCTFVSEHYQIHSSLLPGSITLMIFKKQNSAFNNARKQTHGMGHTNLDSGSQIRLKYPWTKFFQILWINAKQNKHFGVEIPELGWKLSAIEKFKGSMKRSLAKTLRTALCNGYITQDKFDELVQFFCELNQDFSVSPSTQQKQKMKSVESTENVKIANTFECKDMSDEETEEDLIRNAKEATEFFDKNNFKLSPAEPRFTKVVQQPLSAYYLGTVLPMELKKLNKTARLISDLLNYEWRIGVDFDTQPQIYIEFYSGDCRDDRFRVWAQLKQKLNIDKEGDDNTYNPIEIGKECAVQYFDLMKKIYTKQKLELLSLHNSEEEYIQNQKLLKQLHCRIPILYFPPKVNGEPFVRPSQFKNNWWECCVKYGYPGREILDKVKLSVEETCTTQDDTKVDFLECMDQFIAHTEGGQSGMDDLITAMERTAISAD